MIKKKKHKSSKQNKFCAGDIVIDEDGDIGVLLSGKDSDFKRISGWIDVKKVYHYCKDYNDSWEILNYFSFYEPKKL